MGYKESQGDHKILSKHSPSSDYDRKRQHQNQHLAKEFEIKASGQLKYFLGMRQLTLDKAFYVPTEVCY